MKRLTLIATALLLAVFAVLSTRAAAQEANTQEVTYLTFSNSVEMPGVTLPAGTYTFRLADTPSRNVVQVLDRDGKDIKGQWLFVQAERPEVTGDTVIMFKENREGAMPAIQYWYFPGEKIGKEFIYPKEQAEKIAARTGQQVRTESGYIEPSSADSQGQVAEAHPAEPNVVEGAGVPPAEPADNSAASVTADTSREVAPAPSQPAPSSPSLTARADVDTNTNTRAVGTSGTLPKTASPLPFAQLIGLLSLAGAFGLRAVRQ